MLKGENTDSLIFITLLIQQLLHRLVSHII